MNHSEVYERLLAIHFEIEPQMVPDPHAINVKIGECHRFIDEVEQFAIKANQELSINQKALNDSQARYEHHKEELLSNDDEVKALPSFKDREAKVNSKLIDLLQDIRNFQNDVSACTNILRAINLKLKNLNRANADIKMQLRMLEAQVKLGTPMMSDRVTQGLMRELASGIQNDDVLGDIETTASENELVDPTEPVDVDALMEKEEAPAGIVGPDADPDEDDDGFGDVEDVEDPTEQVFEEPSEEAVQEAEKQQVTEVDLDQIIDGNQPEQKTANSIPQGGAEPKTTQSDETESAPSTKAEQQKEPESSSGSGVDIESLLSQFS